MSPDLGLGEAEAEAEEGPDMEFWVGVLGESAYREPENCDAGAYNARQGRGLAERRRAAGGGG